MANLIKRYRWFTLFLTVLTLAVVMVGAYTRLSDAGLGCPDWPGCYGSLIVPEQVSPSQHYADIPLEKDKAWIEMIHRYIAGTLGLCVFVLTILAFKKSSVIASAARQSSFEPNDTSTPGLPRYARNDGALYNIRGLLLFTSLLIIFQALLGMWTVTKLLHPTIVMLHLLGGMATLSLVWLAHIRLQNLSVLYATTTVKLASIIGLIIVVLQIALGGWVSTNYAAFACPDFPTCQAQWWPSLDLSAFNIFIPIDRNFDGGFLDHPGRVTIHFIHRVGAIITAGYLLLFSLYGLYNFPAIKYLFWSLLLVLTLQVSLGIINIVALLPLWAAVLHNGMAAILLLLMVTISYRLLKGPSL